jgi:hypothetical protein
MLATRTRELVGARNTNHATAQNDDSHTTHSAAKAFD